MPTIFNQQKQTVSGNQFNSAGDINIGLNYDRDDIVKTLNSLVNQLNDLVSSGIVTRKDSIDIKAKLEKAALEAEEAKPDKKSILQNLEGAKQLISSIASAVGLVSSLAQAIELVKKVL